MNLISSISKSVLLCISLCVLSCNKDTTSNELTLSYQYLADKTWYLDYSQTSSLTKTYIGQSTYFINFLKDNSTKDSDGIVGVYNIEKLGNQLQIHVNAKTNGSNPVEYIYNIESVGSKELVVFYSTNTQTVKKYFSVR